MILAILKTSDWWPGCLPFTEVWCEQTSVRRAYKERRVVISQRVTRLARKVAQMGGADQAVGLARGAKRLSPRWHEQAYRSPVAAASARWFGFGFYEALNRRLRGRALAE